jgi:hypothetical protein
MQWHLILIIEKHENVYYIAAPVSLDQNERNTFYAAKLYNAFIRYIKKWKAVSEHIFGKIGILEFKQLCVYKI